jgi:hypothetical protein
MKTLAVQDASCKGRPLDTVMPKRVYTPKLRAWEGSGVTGTRSSMEQSSSETSFPAPAIQNSASSAGTIFTSSPARPNSDNSAAVEHDANRWRSLSTQSDRPPAPQAASMSGGSRESAERQQRRDADTERADEGTAGRVGAWARG